MMFSQAKAMLARLLPFVGLLLVYESFRGIADYLNSNVNYELPAHVDKAIFGTLPTVSLQQWWWQGSVGLLDLIFYLVYLLHFILPVGLAIIIWKTKERFYWRFVTSFLVVSFMGFITFVLFPAAPPWMSSELGYIEPIERISSEVWNVLGLSDFPTVYDSISPNPVAAVPSLHAAWAALLSILVFKIYGRRWGAASLLYPALIFVGTVYQGEHYVFDIFVGVFYAAIAYWLTPRLLRWLGRWYRGSGNRLRLLVKRVESAFTQPEHSQ